MSYARRKTQQNARDIKTIKADMENLGGGGLTTNQVNTLIDAKISPLTSPVSAGLTITTPAGAGTDRTVEVGTSVTPVLAWTITNHANAASAKIVDTSNANATLATPTVAASGTYTASSAIQKTTAGSQGYRFDVTDKAGAVKSSPVRTINWQYPVFYGASSSATLDATGITGLSERRAQANMNGTYAFTGGGTNYKYICIPASFTTVNMFDNATGFAFPLTEQAGGNIDVNVNGVTVAYKVLRSNNQIGDATARN